MSSRSLHVALSLSLAAYCGCRLQKPATLVPPPPTIESFTASATAVRAGSKVTLAWKTSDATSVELREAASGELDVAADTLEGSYATTIETASLFVLVARGAGGSTARAVFVAIEGAAGDGLALYALPPSIPGGASTTLSWLAPGATSVAISSGGQAIDLKGQRSSGAVMVSPKFDSTYTLTADGKTKSARVTVQPALLTAEATPRAAEVGDSVTVRWTAAGAERVVVVSPGRGQLFEASTAAGVESGSFVDVVPPSPRDGVITYQLAAVKGSERSTRTLEVNVGTGLSITRFECPPVAGTAANYALRWETRAADQVEVKVDGVTVHATQSRQIAAQGSFSFPAPAADFVVVLVATNLRGGMVSKTTQVDGAVGIPTSATLAASPSSVALGQPVTLTYASAEARRVRIVDSQGQAVFSVTGQTAQSGMATVYPTTATTYTLSADNLLGSTPVTATASVTVTGAPVTVTQFPPTALTGQKVTLSAPAGATLSGFPHEQVLANPQATFVDISGTGARVLLPNSNVVSVELPFSTFLWGQLRTGPLTISRAGWMAWGAPLIVSSVNPTTLPSTSGPPGLIAPFWDELTLLSDSAVYAELVGEAPEQSLVVQWDKLQVGTDASSQVTFQARVHQRGMVSFHYQTMRLGAGAPSYVVGLQDETRLLGVRSWSAPGEHSSLEFFSPLPEPVDVRVVKGAFFGGFVKVGNAYALVSQRADAYVMPGDVALTEFMFRPHAAVPNGQYVELLNRTDAPLDLSGWELRGPNTPTFRWPSGFRLQPNAPALVGASVDPAENDDAGVSLSWRSSGFFLSEDGGSFTVGTADAGQVWSYGGPPDGGRGLSVNLDPGPIIGTSGAPGVQACSSTAAFGGQSPPQLGTPGAVAGCGFGYALETIPSRFVDISDGGTPLLLGRSADSIGVPITLATTEQEPAPLAFGVRQPVVSMGGNGYLLWGSFNSSSDTNKTVAGPLYAGSVAVFWDDLDSLAPQSEMYWKRFAASEDPATPEPHWVFLWKSISYWSSSPSDDLNFEAKLFESGVIEYHYGAMTSSSSASTASGASATVWLENPVGTQALVISINQPLIRPFSSFRFVPR